MLDNIITVGFIQIRRNDQYKSEKRPLASHTEINKCLRNGQGRSLQAGVKYIQLKFAFFAFS